MKKLNNKGFTLVELLAVVVILAVVMGIAMTSVITAMNNSRKGSLEDSAKAVANAFKTKYSEALVTNTTNNVYPGYAFNRANSDSPVFYSISKNLEQELNLSSKTYMLTDDVENLSVANKEVQTKGSFVAFDGNKFVACLIAEPTGSYYVANAAGGDVVSNIFGGTNSIKAKLGDTAGKTESESVSTESESVFKDYDNKVMWACSDGQKSWE